MIRACSKCGVATEFADNYPARRGYWCKPCKSAYNVESAKRNRDTKRKNNNAWHARNSANRAEASARYRSNHPEKRKAHQAVQSALRNGTLLRQNCSVCAGERAHAHHDDYAKPMDVIWLCHRHHMERHQMLEARK